MQAFFRLVQKTYISALRLRYVCPSPTDGELQTTTKQFAVFAKLLNKSVPALQNASIFSLGTNLFSTLKRANRFYVFGLGKHIKRPYTVYNVIPAGIVRFFYL